MFNRNPYQSNRWFNTPYPMGNSGYPATGRRMSDNPDYDPNRWGARSGSLGLYIILIVTLVVITAVATLAISGHLETLVNPQANADQIEQAAKVREIEIRHQKALNDIDEQNNAQWKKNEREWADLAMRTLLQVVIPTLLQVVIPIALVGWVFLKLVAAWRGTATTSDQEPSRSYGYTVSPIEPDDLA